MTPIGCGQFLSFSHYMSMGAVYGHGSHLDLRTTTICIYFQSPFNTRLRIKLEIWTRGFRAEVFKGVNGRTDDGQSDHNSSSRAFGSGELKMVFSGLLRVPIMMLLWQPMSGFRSRFCFIFYK